ncbi:hypothetical protein Tco_0202255, partial [Tanacetum coccineum]
SHIVDLDLFKLAIGLQKANQIQNQGPSEFKKFFKRRGRFARQPRGDRKTFQRSKNDGYDKSERKYFRCGVTQVTSLENVQSRQRTTIKEHSLEEHEATMEKMKWKILKMKLVL